MKLKTFIQKLESKRQAYINKHGAEPEIFSWDVDMIDGHQIHLCSKITRGKGAMLGARVAKRPYLEFQIK